MTATSHPNGYSRAQIILHWAVVVLIVFQFVAHDGMEEAWHALESGAGTAGEPAGNAWPHIAGGLLVFVLALWRVVLRLRRGAPKPPDSEPAPLRFLASATHIALYALILGMPISGSVAWFGGVEAAARAHGIASTALFFLALLHVCGAIVQHLVFRSDVVSRMLSPRD